MRQCCLHAAVLSACGGAGSCTNCSTPTPTPTPGTLSLSIEAPSQYPAGLPVSIDASLTMTNTSSVDASNLVYTIPAPNEPGNYTKVVITPNAGVGSASGDCTNIAAGASCTFVATISAYASPGSFTVTATPNSTAAAKTTQSSKSLQADSISVTANLGLVDVPNTQNQYYILPSDQTITANSNESSVVMVSVWVKQASEGLNSLHLVDETGAALSFSAVGTTNYAVNSVNTYLVTIPAGKTLQHIQAFGYNNDTSVCNTLNIGTNNNTACSNDADVNLATQGNGILTIQPSYTVMSESYNTQVITLTNTGTGDVSSITYPNWGELASQFSITNNNCTSLTKLSAGQSCTMILNYTANSLSSAITPVFSYDDDNNGSTSPRNTAIIVSYQGLTPPNPGPDPTPVTSWSILSVSPVSISLTQSNPVRVITLTNTPGGDTSGANLTSLTLPSLAAPLEFESTSCTSTLAVGDSCIYTIKYSSAVSAGQESLPFTYNNGVSTGQTASLAVDWAIFAPSPAPVPATSCNGNCRIFVSSGTYTGDLKSEAITAGGTNINTGFEGADYLCQIDANNPVSGSTYWKALLLNNNSTVVGTDYYKLDNSTLIATASNGDLIWGSGGNLVNIIGIPLTGPDVWTGGYGSGYNCNDWTSPSATGSTGNSGAGNNPSWFQYNFPSCTPPGYIGNLGLYCVEQFHN